MPIRNRNPRKVRQFRTEALPSKTASPTVEAKTEEPGTSRSPGSSGSFPACLARPTRTPTPSPPRAPQARLAKEGPREVGKIPKRTRATDRRHPDFRRRKRTTTVHKIGQRYIALLTCIICRFCRNISFHLCVTADYMQPGREGSRGNCLTSC